MTTTLVISILTCFEMMTTILVKPSICVQRVKISLYWLVAVGGALCLLLFGAIDLTTIWSGLTSNTAVNPLKILVLFISMTALSVFLDEVGFFQYLAIKSLSRVGTSQKRFFFLLYLLVSVLTIFTSNDVVVLTFTPFICYYAKNAKVDPVPYLVGEFVAANSLSLTLIIGNPTNIYLATSYGISFGKYFAVMILPAIVAGVVAMLVTYLIFHRQLQTPIETQIIDAPAPNKTMLGVGLTALCCCTILLAISSYVGFEMWYISLGFALALLMFGMIFKLANKQYPTEVIRTIKRCPWELIPFVISMFVIVLALNEHDITKIVAQKLYAGNYTILTYGASSFLFANLINNIPMSILFSSAVGYLPTEQVLPAVFASIIGSNIGAYLTPVGALAGIMWLGILKNHQVKFTFLDFVKYGSLISIPTLLASLGALYLSMIIF